MPYKYKVISTFRVDAKALFDYEQSLHSLLKTYRYYPKLKFGGYTECYDIKHKEKIMVFFA